jgi:3-demethoxyubiquinol 3-hydroxylase
MSDNHTSEPVDEPRQLPPRPLPGEPDMDEAVHRMIRVDHAGEYGATRIYKGQLDVMGAGHPRYATIKHMADQEDVHLKAFDGLMAERGVRPTLLGPLWNVAGYALGATTALMGEKAAMACTVAVEEVITEHYEDQRTRLRHWNKEPALEATIAKFQAEEVEHRDIGLEHGAGQATGYKLLSGAIKTGCRAAIWLSKRI